MFPVSLKMSIIPLIMLGLAYSVSGIAVMSVDLGSEWMKIAVVSPGVPMEIVLNPESKRKTSMAVSLKDGERKYGSDAMTVCVKSPKHCYRYLLDLLGKKADHPLVSDYKTRFPEHAISACPERGTVLFTSPDSPETTYSVEELVGMMLAHAKQQAEVYTEQNIKDAVITVPVYFNQAERLALVAAANLGGLNVLQLINTATAVGLNYGMFRRKEVNNTVKNFMFYDMGAQQTTATIVGFQIVKTKERGFSETHPQAAVLGVGYDRKLGGQEITFRLRDHLAKEFNAMGKTKTDVTTVPRAMGKLLKEAERVKLVLSANTECYAQVENVMEDIDFKVGVSRELLLELGADLMERVTQPVAKALQAAAMEIKDLEQVILVGGGTRVPRVQELLQGFLGQELGKSLNTDESAAMGAVYRAADLSTGFKVKKFLTKDTVLFPIDVDFERVLEAEEGSGDEAAELKVKKVRRALFQRMNPVPQKKIMTFNKHQQDFTFNVNYADVDYLGPVELSYLGSMNLTSVLVKGVKEALDANAADNSETKGVKAHFTLDDSGILSITGIESVFEKTISPEEQEKQEKEGKKDEEAIDWSKLGDTISNFFGSEDKVPKEDDKDKAEEKKDEKKEKKDEAKPKKDDKEAKKEDKKESKEPKKPKIETVKTELSSESSRNDIELLDGETFEASKSKLAALNAADAERVAREGALNELQSLSFDLQEKMYEEEYEKASTEDEREKIRTECSAVSDWLDEEAGVETPLEDFTSRLKTLKELMAPIAARVKEHRGRPEALEKLEQVFNSSNNFLEKSRELVIKPKVVVETPEEKPEEDEKVIKTEEEVDSDKEKSEKEKPKEKKKTIVPESEGLFKEKELDVLAKKIAEVKKWRDEKVAEQEAAPSHEMPKLTVSMINSKIHDVESEVQFLIQKAKMLKAEQERAKRKAEAEAKKAEEDKKKQEKKAKKSKKSNDSDTSDSDKSEDAEPSKDENEGINEDSTEKKPDMSEDDPGSSTPDSSDDPERKSEEPLDDLTDREEL